MAESKLRDLSTDFAVQVSAKCTSLRVMLIASCRTAKGNIDG